MELVSIAFSAESAAEKDKKAGSCLTVGDSLTTKMVVNYNGPKVSQRQLLPGMKLHPLSY